MVKTLSTAPSWLWYDSVDPGLSETNTSVFNWWLNTSTGVFFSCLDNTIGAQVWERLVVQGDDFSFGNLVAASGGALQTNTGTGNTLLLQAYDTDTGPAYVTFATLTAGTTPTMDLSDSVTKASGYIYRAGGTDVPVADGGSGASTLTGILTGNGTSAFTASTVTQNGVLYGGATNSVSSLAVASTGTILIGNTGAAPSFSATPSVTSIAIGTPTITSGSGAPAGSAPQGSLYLRTDGSSGVTRAYINTDGATSWTPILTSA